MQLIDRRRLTILSVSLFALTLVINCLPQSVTAGNTSLAAASAAKQEPWWKHAVFYEIYPRSFADSNNSGTGNINGIISKLDYLKDLGVDAIWITPCYPSPQVDFGYDISDYQNIAPEYGKLADMEWLIAEAKKRNIKIIMDLVLNHTSDQHRWFVESRSSATNPKRNWYIWRDGKNGGPPNNWLSIFGHSAWTFDPSTKQYYYHFFYAQQPDLNWRNPEVKKAMFNAARFWLDRGVAGFRLDAITTLFEDPYLTDNPLLPGKNDYGDPNMEYIHNDHLPQVHDVLKDLRKLIDSYPGNRVLIGETVGKSVAELSDMYGVKNDEIQLPMNFFFAYINRLSASEFRRQIFDWDNNPKNGWPVYLLSNHDSTRHYVRYGDSQHNDQIAKLMAAVLLTLRGTPILYYGEELGMDNKDPKSISEVRDPIGKTGWPKQKGRDGERTPMQWSADTNAGFSKATPWLPITDNFKTHNVAVESGDRNSILNFYKQLIQLRRTNGALSAGRLQMLNGDQKNVLLYVRKTATMAVFVALNMNVEERTVNLDLKSAGLEPHAKLLLSSIGAPSSSINLQDDIILAPFGAYIWQVTPQKVQSIK